jgi:hypothetical protein
MIMKSIPLLFILFIFAFTVDGNNVRYKVEREHQFSSTESKDKFQIVLTGDDIINGEVNLIILSTAGDTIFTESFPSRYLIGYGLFGEEDTKEKKESYILKRMNEFFDEGNFSQPAIRENESCDPDYSDCEIWDALKKDQTTIGFHYLIGEERSCSIAYSKILKRVVKYFCCC